MTSKTETSVSLSWDPVEHDGGIDKYEIYRDGRALGTRKGGSYSDNGLTASTNYKYQVAAIANNGSKSDLSDPLNVTTDDPPPPSQEPDPESGD